MSDKSADSDKSDDSFDNPANVEIADGLDTWAIGVIAAVVVAIVVGFALTAVLCLVRRRRSTPTSHQTSPDETVVQKQNDTSEHRSASGAGAIYGAAPETFEIAALTPVGLYEHSDIPNFRT